MNSFILFSTPICLFENPRARRATVFALGGREAILSLSAFAEAKLRNHILARVDSRARHAAHHGTHQINPRERRRRKSLNALGLFSFTWPQLEGAGLPRSISRKTNSNYEHAALKCGQQQQIQYRSGEQIGQQLRATGLRVQWAKISFKH